MDSLSPEPDAAPHQDIKAWEGYADQTQIKRGKRLGRTAQLKITSLDVQSHQACFY